MEWFEVSNTCFESGPYLIHKQFDFSQKRYVWKIQKKQLFVRKVGCFSRAKEWCEKDLKKEVE